MLYIERTGRYGSVTILPMDATGFSSSKSLIDTCLLKDQEPSANCRASCKISGLYIGKQASFASGAGGRGKRRDHQPLQFKRQR